MAVATNDARAVFLAALDLSTPTERAAYLDEACAGDAALRQRVEALLRAHDEPGAFLSEAVPDPTATTGYMPALVGTVIAGRYKLLEAIGEGGMGTVWVAEQIEPVRRKVALKLIKAGMDSKSVLARFEAERQALAVMDHPNIAKVLDGGLTETGRPYFVMEYVKGVPITEYCDATRLSVPERLNLFVQVCSAVQHAHQKGIIHRDLKPSNILVAPYDDKPVPKVIDFGLAKAMHQSLTERTLHTAHETVLGTPLYMSPEQAQLNNLDVDTRSDIYSLGVLLYELLTGTTPLEKKRFKEAAWDEIKRIIREEEPPRPSTRLSSSNTLASLAAGRQMEPARLTKLVRGELDWIVMKALEKDRARRYETANGFAADIQRYLGGEPVLAVPPSARYRLRKFARKHRAAFSTAAAIALLLVAGVAVSTWQAVRATQARAAAMSAEKEARQAQQAEADRAEGERLATIDAVAKKAEAERAQVRAEAGEKLAGERLVLVEAEKRKAEEEKKIAQAVRDFLQHKLLGQADSRKQADALLRVGGLAAEAKENPTIRELLDRAAKELAEDKIEANFPKQPLLQAELLRTVGDTYRGVGEYELAIGFLQRSAALLKQQLGADHQDTLIALNDLASAYLRAGKLTETIKLLEQIRDIVVKPGADYGDTHILLGNLALAYRNAGKLNEAIALFEQVRDAFVKKRGADDPDTLTIMSNLAGAYMAAGKLNDAIQLGEQVRDARVKQIGADHPDTLITLNDLAVAYWKAKQLNKSVPLFVDVLKRQEARLGRQHPETQMTVGNLGVNYKDAGRLTEALPLLEEAFRASRKFPTLRWVSFPLLDAYTQAGRSAEAVKLVHEVLPDVRKVLPKESVQLADVLAHYSRMLVQLKANTDAEPLLRECLAIREKKEPDVWTTFNTKSVLGWALLGQKKYADAEPLLLSGYEGMKQREKTIPPQGSTRIPEALDRLIELCTATNKPDDTKNWRAERAKYPDFAPPPRVK